MTQKVIKFNILDSTNNYVAKALKNGKYRANDVILAGFQTEGRGQRGNIWQGEFGKNLTFSFGFSCHFLPLDDQFVISKAISVGIAKYLEKRTNCRISLKWPNDILVNNRKISGILLETILVNRHRYIIVGIGLNVNQTSFQIENQTSSLSLELGRSLELDEELSRLLDSLNFELALLKQNKIAEIENSYFKRLKGTERFIRFSENGKSFKGLITSVDRAGVICVKSQQGLSKTYRTGEVKTVPPIYLRCNQTDWLKAFQPSFLKTD